MSLFPKKHSVRLRGYDVLFPLEPYDVQKELMSKMLEALQDQGNALLEAPTGCGKTLSLLCAALAWQENEWRTLHENWEKEVRVAGQAITAWNESERKDEEQRNGRKGNPDPQIKAEVGMGVVIKKEEAKEVAECASNDMEARSTRKRRKHQGNNQPSSKEHRRRERKKGKRTKGGGRVERDVVVEIEDDPVQIKKEDEGGGMERKDNFNVRGNTHKHYDNDDSDDDDGSDSDEYTDRSTATDDDHEEASSDESDADDEFEGLTMSQRAAMEVPLRFRGGYASKANHPFPSPASGNADDVPLDLKPADIDKPTVPDDTQKMPRLKLPRIFFATRTHSQIAQVVRELKRTAYRPDMAILASRSHYCVNKAVLRTGRIDEECDRMRREDRLCVFQRGVSTAGRAPRPLPSSVVVHDIEDFKTYCGQRRRPVACPYFESQRVAERAALIFCPYSYILDPAVRRAMKLDLKDDVIIFDEAHNIEDVSRDSGSVELTLDDLRRVRHAFELAEELSDSPELYRNLSAAFQKLLAWLERFDRGMPEATSLGMRTSDDPKLQERVWNGAQAAPELLAAGFPEDQIASLWNDYEAARAHEEKAQFDTEDEKKDAPPKDALPGAGNFALMITCRLLITMQFFYQRNLFGRTEHEDDYLLVVQRRINIVVNSNATTTATTAMEQRGNNGAVGFSGTASASVRRLPRAQGGRAGSFAARASAAGAGRGGVTAANAEQPQTDKPGSNRKSGFITPFLAKSMAPFAEKGVQASALSMSSSSAASSSAGPVTVTFCLWCMNPAVTFGSIAAKSHSVILASGTLAPLDTFATELGTEFHVRLEGQHVVDMSRQVWAAVVPRGPGGVDLNNSFNTRGTFAVQDGLGQSLLRLCAVVPGGILVFAAGYGVIHGLRDQWKRTGLWEKLEALKPIFMEPKQPGADFDRVTKAYLEEAEAANGGALMLAVYRGKASEGIDFRDAQARAVVLLGIPYPAARDTKVVEKRHYNDNVLRLAASRSAAAGGQEAKAPPRRVLTGQRWYIQQGFRALNQAAGRCIRHRTDFGAILLMDSRFRHPDNRSGISKWVRDHVKTHDRVPFDETIEDLRAFFARLAANPPVATNRPCCPSPSPSPSVSINAVAPSTDAAAPTNTTTITTASITTQPTFPDASSSAAATATAAAAAAASVCCASDRRSPSQLPTTPQSIQQRSEPSSLPQHHHSHLPPSFPSSSFPSPSFPSQNSSSYSTPASVLVKTEEGLPYNYNVNYKNSSINNSNNTQNTNAMSSTITNSTNYTHNNSGGNNNGNCCGGSDRRLSGQHAEARSWTLPMSLPSSSAAACSCSGSKPGSERAGGGVVGGAKTFLDESATGGSVGGRSMDPSAPPARFHGWLQGSSPGSYNHSSTATSMQFNNGTSTASAPSPVCHQHSRPGDTGYHYSSGSRLHGSSFAPLASSKDGVRDGCCTALGSGIGFGGGSGDGGGFVIKDEVMTDVSSSQPQFVIGRVQTTRSIDGGLLKAGAPLKLHGWDDDDDEEIDFSNLIH